MINTQNIQTSLTMIIPSRERSDFLERVLFYYFTIGFEHKIIIADSSTKKHLIHNKETIEKVNSKLNISHEIYDETMEIVEKLDHALSHVKTPYVVFGDDDDFFVPKTLELAVDFLNCNPEYSSVTGESLVFNLGSQKSHGKIKFFIEYPQKSIEDDNVNIRLIKHLSAYTANWASVRRTNQLTDEWNSLKPDYWDVKFMELLPTCLSIIQGKAKKLDCLYTVRQAGAPKSYVPFSTIHEWVCSPSWGQQYTMFSQIICEYLVLRANMDIDTAKKTVNTALWLHLTPPLYYEHESEMKKYFMNRRYKVSQMPIIILRHFIFLFRINTISKIHLSEKIHLYKLSRKIPSFNSDLYPIIEAVECETNVLVTDK